jgi:hypothetical protein
VDPTSADFPSLGGSGQFTLATGGGCAWTLNSSQPWLSIAGPSTGTGQTIVSYTVAGPNLLQQRQGIISISQQSTARILVTQAGLLPATDGQPRVSSDLQVAGGEGQVVWNGTTASYATPGITAFLPKIVPGSNRVEAQLVSAAGKPGTWRFQFTGHAVSGLRPLTGKVEAVAPDSITFRLSGRPGERVVFVFEAEP